MAWKKGTATDFLDFIDKIESFCTKTLFAGTVSAGGGNTGDGIVYGASATDDSVAETWTLTCTTGGGNGVAIFSVSGSVSGAQANATCGEPYSIAETSFTILGGAADFVATDSFTFAVASGTAEYTVKRGNSTGGNVSNDYLSNVEWGEFDSESCIVNEDVDTLGLQAYTGLLATGDLSISMWVWPLGQYFPTGSSNDQYPYMRVIASPPAGSTTLWFGEWGTPTSRTFVVDVGLSPYSITMPSPLPISTWTHVCITINRTTNAGTVYINGTSTATGTLVVPVNTGRLDILTDVGASVVHPPAGALRDIQCYTKVLSPAEVSTIYGGGTATGVVHRWVCDEGTGEQYVQDSIAGSSYDMEIGPTKKELIIMGKGDAGTSEIYTGVQSYTNAVDRWNFALQAFTGYVDSNGFSAQPGAISAPPGMLLQDAPFNYYIHTTPNRIFLYADVGGNDESAYLGWYIPYFSEDQWGYPVAVGGSAEIHTIAPSDTTDDHRAWFNLSDALQILKAGAWSKIKTSDPMSVDSFNSTSHDTDINGEYPLFDFIPFSAANSLYFGSFEGTQIPVRANTLVSGDVLVDSAKARLVIGDTFRTGQGTLVALDLTGD